MVSEASLGNASCSGESEATNMEIAMNKLCQQWSGEGGSQAESLEDERASLQSKGLSQSSDNLKEKALNSEILAGEIEIIGSDEDYESATDEEFEADDQFKSSLDLLDGSCASSLKCPKTNTRKRRRRKKPKSNLEGKSNQQEILCTQSNLLAYSPSSVNKEELPYTVSPTPLQSSESITASHPSQDSPCPSIKPSTSLTESRSRHPSTSSESSTAALRQATALGLRGGHEDALPLPPMEEHLWLAVSGGGCWLPPTSWPDWFNGGTEGTLVKSHWREQIFEQLTKLRTDLQPLRGVYREVVRGGNWTIAGKCRWLVGGHWYPANLLLTIPDANQQGTHCCEEGEEQPTNNSIKEPFLEIEFTSSGKRKFTVKASQLLLFRVHIQVPSRCLLALYSNAQPQEPLCLLFSTEIFVEEWADNIASVMWHVKRRTLVRETESSPESIDIANYRELKYRPSPYTIWATTLDGSIYYSDYRKHINSSSCDEEPAGHQQNKLTLLNNGKGRQIYPLLGGFCENASVAVTFTVNENCRQFHLNLQCSDAPYCSVALHCNPRVSKKVVVLNSYHKGAWGQEERHKVLGCSPGSANTILIACQAKQYKIIINGRAWQSFEHRLAPESVSHLLLEGDFEVTSITYKKGLSKRSSVSETVWEGVGGHLIHVAGGAEGIVWGLSNDCHAYIFTGGRGGGPYLKSLAGTTPGLVHPQSDVVHDYLWENQRWNPVTGFTARGLPTDRRPWTQHSKPTIPKTKEEVKLPSRHWSWVS